MSQYTPPARLPWRPYVQLRKSSTPTNHPIVEIRPGDIDREALNVKVPDWSPYMQTEARNRLIHVCEWLKPRLMKPPRVQHLHPMPKSIRFLDVLNIFVDIPNRQIRPYLSKELNTPKDFFAFKLGKIKPNLFLAKAIIQHLKSEQKDLFITEDEIQQIDRWLIQTLFTLLHKNKSFLNLINQEIPAAIGIPKALYAIALAAKLLPCGPMLDLRTFNIVWEHEAQFRQVARENPHLLKLLMAFCSERRVLNVADDPVKTMKTAMMKLGVSEAGWRYLAHYGSRLFKTAWKEIWAPRQAFNDAANYVRALQHAGLPPPPPPSIARVWLHDYNPHAGDQIERLTDKLTDYVDGRILRVALIEADKRRHTLHSSDFQEEFLGVCHLGERLNKFPLDKNQIKAGWNWLVREYKHQELLLTLYEKKNIIHWSCRLDCQSINGWDIFPITNSADLMLEAIEMRNCLYDYADKCQSGSFEVYSVRAPKTGKRKATFGFNFPGNEKTYIFDTKGFANTPLNAEMNCIGHELLDQLNDQREDEDPVFDELVKFSKSFTSEIPSFQKAHD